MIGHEIGSGRTVQAEREQVPMCHGGRERFHPLPGQHRAHRFNRDGDSHGYALPDRPKRVVDSQEAGFQVERILGRFHQQQVYAPPQQSLCLFRIGVPQLAEGHTAGDRNRFGRWPHGAGHKAGSVWGAIALSTGPGELGRGLVDGACLLVQTILGQDNTCSAKGIRFNNIRTGLQEAVVNLRDRLRAGQHQVFITALVRQATEIFRTQILSLDGRPHGAIKEQYPLMQEGAQVTGPSR